jgi:REP element-mobilizing transposase RayT
MPRHELIPFDPGAETTRTRRRLPHWFQPGRTYFVTFRLADSLPREKRDAWQRERDTWLQQHGVDSPDLLTEALQHTHHNLFTEELQSLLDAGDGSCVLGRPEFSRVVAEALLFFDGQRCHVEAFVVMPNYVHVLVSPIGKHELSGLLHSWKRHTARQINQLLGRIGDPLWLDENFDHIVRTPVQLDHFAQYIADNPHKANLQPNEYLHYEARPK